MIFKDKKHLSTSLWVVFSFLIIFMSSLHAEEARHFESSGSFGNMTRFSSKKVALDFQDADVKSILRALAEVSGKNIVIDPDVSGTVNITLRRPVRWDKALDIILKINGLDSEISKDIIRIARASTLQKEKQKMLELRIAQQKLRFTEKKARPLSVEIVSINYSTANEIIGSVKDMLSKASGLAEKPSILVDERTNTLIIKDLPEKILAIKSVISSLDKITRQVTIEARIVETSKNFARELGIQWGAVDSNRGAQANATDLNRRRVTFGGAAQPFPTGGGSEILSRERYGYAVNLPLSATPTGAIGLSLGNLLLDRLTLDVQLASMEDQGKGRIVSTPRITTLDNKEAVIQSGSKIPYQTISNNTITTTFVDAQIKLTVTPHITNNNMVAMSIIADKSEPNWGRQVNGMPEITERKASTELIVADGETTVIGGLYKMTKDQSTKKVPWFGNLPFVGRLFRTDAKSNTYGELLIFITPKIVAPVRVSGNDDAVSQKAISK